MIGLFPLLIIDTQSSIYGSHYAYIFLKDDLLLDFTCLKSSKFETKHDTYKLSSYGSCLHIIDCINSWYSIQYHLPGIGAALSGHLGNTFYNQGFER